jgi:glutathione S-transferase
MLARNPRTREGRPALFTGSYVLHGSARSFFTAKVENALRYLELPYDLVEKRPHDGSEIEKRAASGALPVLQTPEDWVLWDSTPILGMLDGRFPNRRILPTTPVQRIGARLLEDWIDEWFTRPAMYTRWNFPESVEACLGGGAAKAVFQKDYFELDDEQRATVSKLLESMAPFREFMTVKVGGLAASTLEKGRDIPVWFEAFLRNLAIHLESHPFLLGNRPCVADFALSGGFHAHFSYDPWPRRFIEERAPTTLAYADRCWNAKADGAGWIEDDTLPETWAPFFEEIEARFLRYLLANREALASDASLVELDLGFGPVSLGVTPYRERSRLDLRDELERLDPSDRARVEQAIPKAILDAYRLPPLRELSVDSKKGVFPAFP